MERDATDDSAVNSMVRVGESGPPDSIGHIPQKIQRKIFAEIEAAEAAESRRLRREHEAILRGAQYAPSESDKRRLKEVFSESEQRRHKALDAIRDRYGLTDMQLRLLIDEQISRELKGMQTR